MRKLAVMILRLLIILLIARSILAEYVPSGPRRYYNAEVDSSRIATGGPLRNYHNGTAWRAIKPEFHLQGNWLLSDSGQHKVGANLTTNVIWIEWNGHYLGLEVAPLYAYRASTEQRIKLADPSFNNRSFNGQFITITDVYPGVNLTIENRADDLKHYYQFSQSARDDIETWWQNNGQHDDVWIVNTFRLHTDSLNCTWSDRVANFTLESPRLLEAPVRIASGPTQFFVPKRLATLERGDILDLPQTSLAYRLLIVNSMAYFAEGFRWSIVRTWPTGTIGHSAIFGNSTEETSAMATSAGYIWLEYYSTGATTGTLDSAYLWGHDSWNEDDSVHIIIYGDSVSVDTCAHSLVDSTARIIITGTTMAWFGEAVGIGASVTSGTEYWLGIYNESLGGTYRQGHDGGSGNIINRKTDYGGGNPVPDPYPADCVQWDNPHFAWYFTITVAGGEPFPFRRRRGGN